MLQAKNIGYWYNNRKEALYENVNLTFERGQSYAILGKSGSGKTTFLSLIAGLDQPKEGEIIYDQKPLKKIGLTKYRRDYVSIIFQSYNLLPYMTSLQNVTTAMNITRSEQNDKKDFIKAKFAQVGIDPSLTNRRVTQLSGGQQQRVAIVRTMCCEHDLIVADEPTGNLDEKTGKDIIELFQEMAHKENKCIIIVTHEKDVADACDKVYELRDKKFSLIRG